jgi:hypothetical protein
MNQISPLTSIKCTKSCRTTWLFSCKNKNEQLDFDDFQRADLSMITLVLLGLAASIGGSYFNITLYLNNSSLFNAFCLISGIVFLVILPWLLIFHLYCTRYCYFQYTKSLRIAEAICVVGFSASFLLSMVSIILAGLCSDTETEQLRITCSSGSNYQLPEGLMGLILVFPMMLSMIVKSVRSEIVFFSWITNFLVIGTILFCFNKTLSLPAFVPISFVSFLNLYEYQRQ